MDDEPLTSREIAREFDRLHETQKATDDRITQLARDMVPLTAHNREIADLQKDVAEHEADAREVHHEIRGELDRRVREVERASKERHETAMGALNELKASWVQRTQFTRQQLVAILLGIGTIVAALVAAYISSRGIK